MDYVADGQLPAVLTDCVKQSLMETFAAICGVEPEFHGTREIEDPVAGVIGIISLMGENSWSLMLGLPPDTAVALAQQFAGFEIPFDSEDMGDAVGELVNILAGDIAARLDTSGIKAQVSLPTVTRGGDIELLRSGEVVSLCLHFTFPEGEFWLNLATDKTD